MEILDILVQVMFLLMPLTVHLLHDVGEINHNHSPNHPFMAGVVATTACLLGWGLEAWTRIHFWQFAVFSLAIHFSCFNYILNFYRKPREPFFYIGNGFWDRLLKPMPPPVRLVVQVAVLVLGWWVCYKLKINY